MVDLRRDTLARIGVSQIELDGMQTELKRLDELCRDLSEVGEALEEVRSIESENRTSAVADLELVRLERELESDVRQCLSDAQLLLRNGDR